MNLPEGGGVGSCMGRWLAHEGVVCLRATRGAGVVEVGVCWSM